jgi:hypothetical protein
MQSRLVRENARPDGQTAALAQGSVLFPANARFVAHRARLIALNASNGGSYGFARDGN